MRRGSSAYLGEIGRWGHQAAASAAAVGTAVTLLVAANAGSSGTAAPALAITGVSYTDIDARHVQLCVRLKGAPNRPYSVMATHWTATGMEGHGR